MMKNEIAAQKLNIHYGNYESYVNKERWFTASVMHNQNILKLQGGVRMTISGEQSQRHPPTFINLFPNPQKLFPPLTFPFPLLSTAFSIWEFSGSNAPDV